LSNNNTDLNDVLSQLNIPDYYSSLGIRVVKAGKKHQAECPFCYDPDHFAYEPAGPRQGLWICPKCNESGNAITLTAKLLNLSNGEAVQHIKKYLGIEDDPQWEGKGAGKMAKQQKESDKTTNTEPLKQDINPSQEGSMAPSDRIYDRFLELTHLTDSDREGLKKDRGFTDALIDQLKFRSGGDYIAEDAVMGQMRREFSEDDLIGKGLLVRVNGVVQVNDQLLNDKKLKRGRYLIPYLDEDGKCFHLRPHKLGFSKKTGYGGYPLAIYCSWLIRDKPRKVVLTEGEFKAAALYQWGIPAIAIPGVSSYVKKYFERLVNFLARFGIQKVLIVFDSEEKGEPNFPNYKPKAEDRYDTEFYSYLNAYKLQKGIGKEGEEGTVRFETYIGTLPAEWRVNGKVDFDMALAQGRTREDIEKCLKAAKPPGEYLADLPEEAKRVVQRKLAKEFSWVPIKRDFNKYVAIRKDKEGTTEQIISNFVLNLKASFQTDEGIIRHVEFVNEFGERSRIYPMDATVMAGVNEFKKFCFNKGNYVFEGSTQDLNNIWKYEMIRDSGEVIEMPAHIGRIEPGLWLFGNLAIQDGKVYRPDEDGVISINSIGYKPQGFQTISGDGGINESAIPALMEQGPDINEIVRQFHGAVGGYEAETMIGWAIATLFSDDIFKEFRSFPILFAYGKRESGKTTAMRWLSCFFGKEEKGYTLSRTTTQNFIIRVLAYRCSLGTWFDEYRNKESQDKSELFRSIYNRQISGKGTNSSFKTRGFAVRSTLAISGEETPNDNALFTRCVHLQFSSYKRGPENFKDWMDANCEGFSAFSLSLIKNYAIWKDKIISYIKDLRKTLIARKITDRTAENWAICAGTYSAVVKLDKGFIKWIEKTCQEIKKTGEQEHMLNQFLEDIYILYSDGQLGKDYIRVDNEFIYLWFIGAYDKWAVHSRKKTGNQAFEKNTIAKYLTDEPYFVAYKNKKMNGIVKKVYVLSRENSPDILKELALAVLAADDPAIAASEIKKMEDEDEDIKDEKAY